MANRAAWTREQRDADRAGRGAAAPRRARRLVTAAANCWPRGSICGLDRRRTVRCRDERSVATGGLPAGTASRKRAGRSRVDCDAGDESSQVSATASGHSTQRRAHAAVVHCAALGEHGRGHDGNCRRGRPSATYGRLAMWTPCPHPDIRRPRPGRPAPGPARGARPRADLATLGVEDQRGRRAQDPEAAHHLEVVLGVDLDVRHARAPRSATSPSTRRVARHGAQNAEENCSSVARSPRGTSTPPRPARSPAVSADGVAARTPRDPVGAAEAPVRRARGTSRSRRPAHADEQHPLSGRHVRTNRVAGRSHSAALSRRRRAAGTPRCPRARRSTVAGSRDRRAGRPRSTEQTPSTASRLVPGCSATARLRTSARVIGPSTARRPRRHRPPPGRTPSTSA